MTQERTTDPGNSAVTLGRRLWRIIDRHPYAFIFLVALLPRVALVIVSDLFTDFVLDDGTYHVMATAMADGDLSGWDDFTYSLYWRTAAFLVPVTAIYKVFGPTVAYAQLFVAIVGATVAVIVVRLALEVLDRKWALAVGLVIALLPSQAFWSSQLMKDATVWLVLSGLGLLIAVANRSKGWPLAAAGAGIAVALFGLAFLREHTLIIAAWATFIASVAGKGAQAPLRIAVAGAFCLFIPWFAADIGPAGYTLVRDAGSLEEIRFKMAQGASSAIVDTTPGGTEEELNEIVSQGRELRTEEEALNTQISEIAEELATAGDEPSQSEQERRALEERLEELSNEKERLEARFAALSRRQAQLQGTAGPGTGPPLEPEGFAPNLKHLPRGLSVMLLEPFPLPFEGSASLKLARLESILWYPLLAAAFIGLRRVRKHLDVLLFPLLAGAGIIVMYALLEGNIGTAHRHRGEFVWVIALLAGLGASYLSDRRRERDT